jgi:hypothetical protein
MPKPKFFSPELDAEVGESEKEHYKTSAKKIYSELIKQYGSEQILNYLAQQTNVKKEVIDDWLKDKSAVFYSNSDKLILRALEQTKPEDFEKK